jgi:hypothetical protein
VTRKARKVKSTANRRVTLARKNKKMQQKVVRMTRRKKK